MKNLALLLILATSGAALAQNPGDFGDDEDPNPIDEPSVPIDGYNGFIAIAGVLFGAYYIKWKKKGVLNPR